MHKTSWAQGVVDWYIPRHQKNDNKDRGFYSGFHFLCSKLWTVADASSFALKLCRILEKICRGVPSSPIWKRIREGSSFPRKSALFISPICGGNFGVSQRQKSTVFCRSLLTCQAAPMGYNNVSLGWAYSRVSLSVWALAVVRLAFTDKILLTGREMLPCFGWLLFQWPTAVKQAKFAAAMNFYCCAYAKLVCYAIARFLAAWWTVHAHAIEKSSSTCNRTPGTWPISAVRSKKEAEK